MKENMVLDLKVLDKNDMEKRIFLEIERKNLFIFYFLCVFNSVW